MRRIDFLRRCGYDKAQIMQMYHDDVANDRDPLLDSSDEESTPPERTPTRKKKSQEEEKEEEDTGTRPLHSIYSPITNLRALGVADRHLLTAHPLDTIWLGAQQFMIQRCLGTLVMASVTQQIRCTSLASLCTAFMRNWSTTSPVSAGH